MTTTSGGAAKTMGGGRGILTPTSTLPIAFTVTGNVSNNDISSVPNINFFIL
jgi:hypothetical protein